MICWPDTRAYSFSACGKRLLRQIEGEFLLLGRGGLPLHSATQRLPADTVRSSQCRALPPGHAVLTLLFGHLRGRGPVIGKRMVLRQPSNSLTLPVFFGYALKAMVREPSETAFTGR